MKKYFVLSMVSCLAPVLCQADSNQSYNNQGQNGYNNQGQSGYSNQRQKGGGYTQTGYGTTPNGANVGQNDQAASQDDIALLSQIRDALHNKFQNKYDGLQLTVSNGKVTIQGVVRSQQESDEVEKVVGLVGPVRSVNNQLMVQGQSQGKPQVDLDRGY